MSNKVFISYSNPDVERASQLAEDIRHHGMEVWFAPSELSGGDRLSAIADYLADAKFVVVLLSNASVNSQWVRYEMNTAIALSLDGKGITVIPVFLDSVERPIAVADFVSIKLHDYERGLTELMAILKGSLFERKTKLAQFEDFLNTLLILDENHYAKIDDVAASLRIYRAERRDQITLQILESTERKFQSVLEDLKADAIPVEAISDAVENNVIPPIITLQHKNEVRAWLRRADERLLALASFLYESAAKHPDMKGFWLSHVKAFLRWHSGLEDEEMLVIETERLAQQAMDADLIMRPRNTHPEIRAAQRKDPWFEHRSALWVIGKYAYLFSSQTGTTFWTW